MKHIEMKGAEAETRHAKINSHIWQFASVMSRPDPGFLMKIESINSVFRINLRLGDGLALVNCHPCEGIVV
jgi:hypothetical protein